MFINKKIALAGALALVFAGSAQAAELSCANPSVVINTITPTSDWSGGADMAPDGYGFNTGGHLLTFMPDLIFRILLPPHNWPPLK